MEFCLSIVVNFIENIGVYVSRYNIFVQRQYDYEILFTSILRVLWRRKSMKDKPKVVIIGGGFGGLQAAKDLGGEDVEVTLIDKKNHHTFQPLLYQVATAVLSPGEIASPIRRILHKFKNVQVILGEVVAFDLEKRTVKLGDDSQISFDYLIVAAGARHSYFGHDEWENSAPGLKTVEDALEIRRRVLLAFELAEREAYLTGLVVIELIEYTHF